MNDKLQELGYTLDAIVRGEHLQDTSEPGTSPASAFAASMHTQMPALMARAQEPQRGSTALWWELAELSDEAGMWGRYATEDGDHALSWFLRVNVAAQLVLATVRLPCPSSEEFEARTGLVDPRKRGEQ